MYVFMERLREDYVDGEQFYDDDLNLICHNVNELDDIKQEKLIAGDGIEISGNTISVTGGTGGAVIDDTVIATDKAWSSSKIKEELDTKQDKEIPEPLCFTAQQANSTIGLQRLSSNQTLEYSTDLTTWNPMTTATTITLANSGDTVYIRGILSANNTSSNYTQFKMTGKIAASGSCNYLWDHENPDAPLKQYCGFNMFTNCTGLTSAPELPATTLANYCYENMFSHCTGLTTAPELPATTLAEYCYYSMFYNCTGLTTVPELPATTLANYCYIWMFGNCTSLTTAPELHATELANGCYTSMFQGCTSLATAPVLPATTLAQSCYSGMFGGCTSLTTVPELPATTLATSCYSGMFYNCTSLNYIKCLAVNGINQNNSTYQWVNGVASSGTFVKESTATGWTLDNVNGIPSGWTVYDHYSDVELDKKLDTKQDKDIPEPLCFTAIETGVTIGFVNEGNYGTTPNIEISVDNKQTWTTWDYSDVSLDNAEDGKLFVRGNNPDGISIRNATRVRISRFTMTGSTFVTGNIMSLINSSEKVYVIPGLYSFSYLFNNCSGLTYASLELPATTLTRGCYEHMFAGCSSLLSAPALPATTLADYCYNNMFYGCSSLPAAPALPAVILAYSCYSGMFQGCTSLTTAPALPATTLSGNCYNNMFNGCSSLLSAPALPATILASYCYFGMFQGCTSLTTAPSILPATTLSGNCYSGMFYNCTNLTTAPELPATILASNCYQDMFNGCTSLNYIKCLATNISATGCTSHWVSGVTSAGTFVKESTMTGWPIDDVSGIPSGWTVYDHYTDVELDKKIDINVTVSDVLDVLNDDTND